MPTDNSSTSSNNSPTKWEQFFPLIRDLNNYSRQFFWADLNAGLVVGIMLIPQAMAYAVLAGMPAIYGLYGSLIPLVIYAFLGSSKHLSIGPVAISSLLIFSGVSQIATPGSPEYISLVITCGLLTGVLQLLIGLTKLGFLANFLSYPVITGFTSAAAVIILLSQLKDFFGVPTPDGLSLDEASLYFFQHLNQFNPLSLSLGLGSLLLMALLKQLSPKIPDALLVVMVGTLLCYYYQLQTQGLAIIGSIPKGLPGFQVPELFKLQQLLPTIFTVTLIGMVECVSIGKRIAAQKGNYTIVPNQEMMAIGLAKIGGSFFAALPSSGSFSRSAINSNAGARTQVSTLITALLILLSLLFLTPLFYFLPKTILAAIIILAVRKLLSIAEARQLWYTNRSDFWMLTATFIATILLGIEIGVLIGVVFSFAMVLYRISKPHIAVLGRVPGKSYYRNIKRFDETIASEDHLIVRLDQQLFFGNADYFKDRINYLIDRRPISLKNVFLDAKGINSIDSSGLLSLLDLQERLAAQDINFFVCNPIGPVRDSINKYNQHSPEDKHIKLSLFLHDAVEQADNDYA
jgi:SulP family sulfate permease